ncbi:hypothetical protein H072_3363 [Dactylellina haptotyla CBS 200.50]|uniref:Uncharacterized protein n=1 Tax=Dactylellina haptotyla (strain CBS 200.50) TaxID=1284197 RepID=S8AHW2_DACHA|nr:hypothetical protein H072_3363 [Dactylellina haptotyla CBS 200.50]
MAAALFSQSCTVASNLYTNALSSLNTIPTLMPSSPSNLSPMFSSYADQILNSQLPFTFDIVTSIKLPIVTIPVPVQNLTFWQVANIFFFVFTVAILSWMLDSHHTDDFEITLSTAPAATTTIAAKSSVSVNVLSPSQPPNLPVRPRRQTLETIATLINLEDIQKSSRRRNARSPLPCSLFSSPISPFGNVTAGFINSAPASPTSTTDVHGHLISPPSGKSASLLRKASELGSARKRNQHRRG